jgi:hypothetical protein
MKVLTVPLFGATAQFIKGADRAVVSRFGVGNFGNDWESWNQLGILGKSRFRPWEFWEVKQIINTNVNIYFSNLRVQIGFQHEEGLRSWRTMVSNFESIKNQQWRPSSSNNMFGHQ